jgi:hypothetical protein
MSALLVGFLWRRGGNLMISTCNQLSYRFFAGRAAGSCTLMSFFLVQDASEQPDLLVISKDKEHDAFFQNGIR